MSQQETEKLTEEQLPKEKLSTPNHLQLMEYKPEFFAGVRADMNLVFHLADGPVAGFSGDQGLCKTSLLNCLIFLLGGDEAVNSMNVTIKDMKRAKQKSASLTFTDKRSPNTTYEVRVTKTSYSVKKIELTDGQPVTSMIQSPKEFIRGLFGPIGVSPMILKEKDGKGQIEWLRSLFRLSKEQLTVENEIKEKLKAKFQQRTGVNNAIKSLFKEVSATPYYKYDLENACFVAHPKRQEDLDNIAKNLKDEETIKTLMTAAQERVRERDRNVTGLEQVKTQKQGVEQQIEQLRLQLQAKEEELKFINSRIQKADEVMKEYADVDTKFNEIQQQMFDLGDLKVKKSQLEEADKKCKEYNNKTQEKVQLVSTIDELRTLMKKFIETFTPKIDGLKVIVDDGIDKSDDENTEASKLEEKLPEGIYFRDRTMQELSESELWGLWAQICRALNIRFLFIENAQSLGSAAAKTINSFVDNGYGCVYYTTMVRGQKELQFTINGQFE